MTAITYEQLLRHGANKLEQFETPMLDARILLMDAAKVDEADLIVNAGALVTSDLEQKFEALLARRLQYEPIAYIVGYKDFWRERYRVTTDVLIPRADSECLIEAVLSLRPPEQYQDITIADAGTGSGCLLGALLGMYRRARGIGIDKSAQAINIATSNIDALGLTDRARFVRGHWFESLEGPIDVIVTNPPYIREDDYGGLAKEITRYEPVSALTSGIDGRGDYREIFFQCGKVIAPDGVIVVEIGDGHATFLYELAKEIFPDTRICIHNDLNACPRALSIDFGDERKNS